MKNEKDIKKLAQEVFILQNKLLKNRYDRESAARIEEIINGLSFQEALLLNDYVKNFFKKI